METLKTLLDQVSSGNIADGEIEDKPQDDPKRDPHLVMFRDRIYEAQAKPATMSWQAAMSSAHPTATSRTCCPRQRRHTSRASTPC